MSRLLQHSNSVTQQCANRLLHDLLREEKAGDREAEHDYTIRRPLSSAHLERETVVLLSAWGWLSSSL